MPNPNAIVAEVVRINPSPEPAAAGMLRAPSGRSVEFEGGHAAGLDPANPRTAHFAGILEELHRMGRPVYVEVHPQTRAITHLRIPLVGQVTGIQPGESGDVLVELDISHARHVLKRNSPDFGALSEALRAARETKARTIVTETDDHEILDVRPHPRPGKPLPPKPPPRPLGVFRPLSEWLLRLVRWLRCLSPQQVQAMFDLVNAQSCAPLTCPAPCIPFLYPDDGCFARASEMCRLMAAAGANPGKVWIYGGLYIQTRNNPNCYVSWTWHVAPTLPVRGPGFLDVNDQVLDPSLFNGPALKASWKSAQGDPNAQLVDTDASVYRRQADGTMVTDPGYVSTDQDLNIYRLSLKQRSAERGPPPYANCP